MEDRSMGKMQPNKPIGNIKLFAMMGLLVLGFGQASEPGTAVSKVLERFEQAKPQAKDLTIYRLDWVPNLAEAKLRAAREKRPILLVVVTNSYGNMLSGHC